MAVIPIEASGEYQLGSDLYTGQQLQRALHCAHSVARAYEIADVANGGDGSVDWSDIDDAQKEAADAMGSLAMRQIIAEACEFNDFESPRSEAAGARDAASLLTAEENAEACAEAGRSSRIVASSSSFGWSASIALTMGKVRCPTMPQPGIGSGPAPRRCT